MSLGEKLLCVICGSVFSEIQELGKWNCKQHPFPIVTTKDNKSHFACCGLKTYSQTCVSSHYRLRPSMGKGIGCVAADHRDTLEPFDDKKDLGWIEIPRSTCDSLGIPADHYSIVPDTTIPESHVRVYRYNWRSEIYN